MSDTKQICRICNGPIYIGDPVGYYFDDSMNKWVFVHRMNFMCQQEFDAAEKFIKECGIKL